MSSSEENSKDKSLLQKEEINSMELVMNLPSTSHGQIACDPSDSEINEVISNIDRSQYTTEEWQEMRDNQKTIYKIFKMFAPKKLGPTDQQNIGAITRVEFFLDQFFQSMEILKFFPALQSVEQNKIKHQILCNSFQKIQGLQNCKHLKILNLTKNKLKNLSGLEHNIELEELHLSENCIDSITGIEHLHNLKIVTIHDNSIASIEPLKHCKNLESVNVANNKISTLFRCLTGLCRLYELNIAGNNLVHFNEIDVLAEIQSLKRKNFCSITIQFSDPHFGSNPLCDMGNYHVYALHCLQFVDVLDGVHVYQDAKELCLTTVEKKLVYYNMQKNYTCTRESQWVKAQLQSCLNQLYRKIFEQHNVTQTQTIQHQEIPKEQINYLEGSIKQFLDTCESFEKIILLFIQCKIEWNSFNTKTLYEIEMNSGGNIRFIELSPDKHSCDWATASEPFLDAFQSTSKRFFRIYKIENNFARYRFQRFTIQKCEELASCDPPKDIPDTMQMYLHGENLSDIVAVIHNWKYHQVRFEKNINNLLKEQRSSSEPIRNILTVNVMSSLCEYMCNACIQDDEKGEFFETSNPEMLCPIYLLQFQHNDNSTASPEVSGELEKVSIPDPLTNLKRIIANREERWKTLFSSLHQYFLQDFFHSCHNNLLNMKLELLETYKADSKPFQKIQEQGQVLPQQFMNLTSSNLSELVPCLESQIITHVFGSTISLKCFSHLTKVYENVTYLDLSFNSISKIPEEIATLQKLQFLNLQENLIWEMDNISRLKPCRLTNLNLLGNEITQCAGFVSYVCYHLPNVQILNLQQRNNWSDLNESISSMCDEKDWEIFLCDKFNSNKKSNTKTLDICFKMQNILSPRLPQDWSLWKDVVVDLDLSASKLIEWPHVLRQMSNLKNLNLSHNYIYNIEHSRFCTSITELDLSHNQLQSVDDLACSFKEETSPRLVESYGLIKLDIAFNNIQDLTPLLKYKYSLKALNCSDNKIDHSFGTTISQFLNLRQLDCCSNQISESRQLKYAIYCCKSLCVLDGKTVTNTETEDARSLYQGKLHKDFLLDKIGHVPFEHIQILDVSSSEIRTLEGIDATCFCNLREIHLDRNSIIDLSQLCNLKSLIVLKANHNQINSVNNGRLGDLKKLEILELSHNKIHSVASLGIEGASSLQNLDLSYNDIKTLDGLNDLKNLRSLNLDANKIRRLSGQQMQSNGLCTLQHIEFMPQLKVINMQDNRIPHIADIKNIKNLANLNKINLLKNPLVRKEGLIEFILLTCPNIMSINGEDVSNIQEIVGLREQEQQTSAEALVNAICENTTQIKNDMLHNNKISKFEIQVDFSKMQFLIFDNFLLVFVEIVWVKFFVL
ncbi:hypothetical protein RFI_14513 [Reticulomyxa filosa]|uniref:Uncharacterized protein n=1 Tax=Reticulomyxa filosa TaxID=46433 RepID=X6NBI6_RETFI|nr:hypothetical protein RFI_14513 [Reticulomyxa filosa]|eukprot:ETO22682.1 hypothetical protein RFI_14513 [Reticulomyxa filosa]